MIQPQAHGARARRRVERKQARGWYRQAKATKCGGRVDGKSEHCIVLMKRGNSTRRRPRGRKAVPNHGTVEGPHAERTDVRERVNATTTDSNACEAGSLSSDGCESRSSFIRHTGRSETRIRGAGCASRARPDLWGAWVSNHPGLPDARVSWPGGDSVAFPSVTNSQMKTGTTYELGTRDPILES